MQFLYDYHCFEFLFRSLDFFISWIVSRGYSLMSCVSIQSLNERFILNWRFLYKKKIRAQELLFARYFAHWIAFPFLSLELFIDRTKTEPMLTAETSRLHDFTANQITSSHFETSTNGERVCLFKSKHS